MHEHQDYYAKDGSSNEPVRAYKVEEQHEVSTISGQQFVGPGVYVIPRDRPELVDVVPADVFEENYGLREVAGSTPAVAETAPAETDYDPNDKTVKQVQAYLRQNPDQRDAVLARERQGQNRPEIVNA